MPAYKMLLDEVEEDGFKLIAIYSTLEEFKMAFLLNKYLHLGLERTRQDIDFQHKNLQAIYALYKFKDFLKHRKYYLVANKYKGKPHRVLSSGSLFKEEELRPMEVNLIPQYKKVDFFLKIEVAIEMKEINRFVSIISQLPQVQAAYKIDTEHLRFKQNLIFE